MRSVAELALMLNNLDFIYDWDELEEELLARKEFSPEDGRVMLSILGDLARVSGVYTSAYHVLASLDPSGRLLERGAILALRSGSWYAYDGLFDFGPKLPLRLSEEFGEVYRSYLGDIGPVIRFLDRSKTKPILERCPAPRSGVWPRSR